MLTYYEVIVLRDKLANGGISLELAKAQFWNDFKEGQRSWHTKDWKERRAKVIKKECEICTSHEILTLQHLSHPRKFSEYKTQITRSFANEFIGANPVIDQSEFRDYILIDIPTKVRQCSAAKYPIYSGAKYASQTGP